MGVLSEQNVRRPGRPLGSAGGECRCYDSVRGIVLNIFMNASLRVRRE